MLRKTRDWVYHGYVMEWDELDKDMCTALIKAVITNNKGKILPTDLL